MKASESLTYRRYIAAGLDRRMSPSLIVNHVEHSLSLLVATGIDRLTSLLSRSQVSENEEILSRLVSDTGSVLRQILPEGSFRVGDGKPQVRGDAPHILRASRFANLSRMTLMVDVDGETWSLGASDGRVVEPAIPAPGAEDSVADALFDEACAHIAANDSWINKEITERVLGARATSSWSHWSPHTGLTVGYVRPLSGWLLQSVLDSARGARVVGHPYTWGTMSIGADAMVVGREFGHFQSVGRECFTIATRPRRWSHARQILVPALISELERFYNWEVVLAMPRGGCGISLPTDATGARAFLRSQSAVIGDGRRALLHWVSEHWRKRRGTSLDDLTFVRSHMRGAAVCRVGDLVATIRPSGYDIKRACNGQRHVEAPK